MRSQRPRLPHHFQAVSAGHADVGDHQRVQDAAEAQQRLAGAGRRLRPPSPAQKTSLESGPHGAIVVHYQNAIGIQTVTSLFSGWTLSLSSQLSRLIFVLWSRSFSGKIKVNTAPR